MLYCNEFYKMADKADFDVSFKELKKYIVIKTPTTAGFCFALIRIHKMYRHPMRLDHCQIQKINIHLPLYVDT